MDEIVELKKLYFELKDKVDTLEIIIPKWFSLSDISHELKKSRDTIRKYLKSNFEPDVDFKKVGVKIYISRDALFLIRKHYAK
jgi:predicted metal-dependent hydrolase